MNKIELNSKQKQKILTSLVDPKNTLLVLEMLESLGYTSDFIFSSLAKESGSECLLIMALNYPNIKISDETKRQIIATASDNSISVYLSSYFHYCCNSKGHLQKKELIDELIEKAKFFKEQSFSNLMNKNINDDWTQDYLDNNFLCAYLQMIPQIICVSGNSCLLTPKQLECVVKKAVFEYTENINLKRYKMSTFLADYLTCYDTLPKSARLSEKAFTSCVEKTKESRYWLNYLELCLYSTDPSIFNLLDIISRVTKKEWRDGNMVNKLLDTISVPAFKYLLQEKIIPINPKTLSVVRKRSAAKELLSFIEVLKIKEDKELLNKALPKSSKIIKKKFKI